MRTVFKYQIPAQDVFTIETFGDYQILHVGMQNDVPMMWVMVDTEADLVKRQFRLAGTGHDLGYVDKLNYRGSFLALDDSLVFHLFEYED